MVRPARPIYPSIYCLMQEKLIPEDKTWAALSTESRDLVKGFLVRRVFDFNLNRAHRSAMKWIGAGGSTCCAADWFGYFGASAVFLAKDCIAYSHVFLRIQPEESVHGSQGWKRAI